MSSSKAQLEMKCIGFAPYYIYWSYSSISRTSLGFSQNCETKISQNFQPPIPQILKKFTSTVSGFLQWPIHHYLVFTRHTPIPLLLWYCHYLLDYHYLKNKPISFPLYLLFSLFIILSFHTTYIIFL